MKPSIDAQPEKSALPGRTVMITGAAGGIGRATVRLFADKGWIVIGVDRAVFGEGFPSDGLFIQSDISIGENLETIFGQAHKFIDHLGSTTPVCKLPNRSCKPVLKNGMR
ncbi:MAG: putative oxidoreductase [Chloroflexi bacterium]|nr:putative oxidoreductase [Chloroflexota bacterium]